MSDSLFKNTALDDIRSLRDAGIEPYPNASHRTHTCAHVNGSYADIESGCFPEDVDRVSVVGRITAIRNNGMFVEIRDESGVLQIYFDTPVLDTTSSTVHEYMRIGDHIEVSGTVGKTQKGQLSIKASRLVPLSKTLQSIPKYTWIRNVQTQVYERVLHLMTNEEARNVLAERFRMVARIRKYLSQNNWMEVETPVLQDIAGWAEARPFETHHNALGLDMNMRIATEIDLKKLIITGMHDKIFEIGKVFRNEWISRKHNPEFTSIELYQAYADYHVMMDLTENIIRASAGRKRKIQVGDMHINLSSSFQRETMIDAISRVTGLDFSAGEDQYETMLEQVKGCGIDISGVTSWGELVILVFEEKVEPTLQGPIFILDYPASVCPLTKKHREYSHLAERFELFIWGMEIANAYSELTDPEYQRHQFERQMEKRASWDDEAHQMDEEFIRAMEYGMPPTGGLGIWIDRLAMLITGSEHIRDVLAFPVKKKL